ncbi:MAG TPA: hypothetical protein VKW77_04950 [Acidimicrobiales bacterium]|nr:hypothetical protein [Acidimicrobiales bacterium]
MTASATSRPDRLVVVRCPDLCEEDEDGAVLRRFATVVETIEAFCPWVAPVRAGVCSLPARGPTRYFGGEERLVRLIGERVASVAGEPVEVGVADGLFAGLLAASSGCVVPAGGTPGFLAPRPVSALGNAELAELLVRLGIRTLGDLAALPEAHVLGRFGADGVACHRVAAGRSGELEGLRDPAFGRRVARWRSRSRARVPAVGGPAGHAGHVHGMADHGGAVHTGHANGAGEVREVGFWGGASDADERAARSLATVQSLLGPEGVVVPRLQGGRTPGARVRFVTWSTGEEDDAPGRRTGEGGGRSGCRSSGLDAGRGGGRGAGRGDGRGAGLGGEGAVGKEEPWPGRIPAPSPALVAGAPRPAELVAADGEPVRVSGRGLLGAPPARLSVDGEPWAPVVAWAGPWPTDERWWSRARRRGARLQVVTGATTGAVRGEVARLLVAERGRWWVEATYA